MSDFLNEPRSLNPGEDEDFFAGTPSAQPQPQPQAQPPAAQPQPQRFIPEGYESPVALNQRIQRLRTDAQRLHLKLSRAGDQDPAKNPYARKKADGKYDFDQFAYDADKRTYDRMMADVNQASAQLQSAMSVTERMGQSLQTTAVNIWKSYESKVPAAMREAVRRRYAENVRHLLDIGHFQQPGYETRDRVENAFNQVLVGIVGQFSLDNGAWAPASGSAAGGKDEKPEGPADEFAGWEPEAVKMFERGMQAGSRRGETLAERAKREAEEARARMQQGAAPKAGDA